MNRDSLLLSVFRCGLRAAPRAGASVALRLVLLSILVLAVVPAFAQQPAGGGGEAPVGQIPPEPDPASFAVRDGRPLALSEALRLAVERNHDIAIQELNVAIYQSIWQALYGRFDALLTLEFDRGDSHFEGYDVDFGADALRDSSSDLLRLQAGKTFSTGTRLGFFLDNTRRDSAVEYRDADDNLVFGQDFLGYTSSFGLNVSQDLLRGFGPRANLAPIRAARADLDREAQTFLYRVLQVLSDVQNGYWELAFAQEDLRIRRFSRALADRQLAVTRARVEAGQRSPVELLQVEEQLAATGEAVLQAEQALATREAALRRLLALEQGEGAPLTPGPMPPVTSQGREAAAVLEQARQRNPQVAAQREAVRSLELALSGTRNALLPALTASAALARVGEGEDLAAAYDQMLGSTNLSWSAGVALSVPIPNRTARAGYRQAVSTLRRAQKELERQEALLAEQVQVALKSVRIAEERVAFASRRLELARQKLAAEEKRYAVGLSTLQDVLTFQEDLEEAALGEVRARVDALKAAVQLQVLEGGLPPDLDLKPVLEKLGVKP